QSLRTGCDAAIAVEPRFTSAARTSQGPCTQPASTQRPVPASPDAPGTAGCAASGRCPALPGITEGIATRCSDFYNTHWRNSGSVGGLLSATGKIGRRPRHLRRTPPVTGLLRRTWHAFAIPADADVERRHPSATTRRPRHLGAREPTGGLDREESAEAPDRCRLRNGRPSSR